MAIMDDLKFELTEVGYNITEGIPLEKEIFLRKGKGESLVLETTNENYEKIKTLLDKHGYKTMVRVKEDGNIQFIIKALKC